MLVPKPKCPFESREQFVQSLKSACRRLHLSEITDKQLKKWVESNVLNKRYQNRPVAGWTRDNWRRALIAAKLNAQGIDRHEDLICHLWLAGQNVPEELILPNLLIAYRRARRQLVSELRDDKKISSADMPSSKKSQNRLEGMGEAASILQSLDIVPDATGLLKVYEGARFEIEHDQTSLAQNIIPLFATMMPGAKFDIGAFAKLFSEMFSGMLDDVHDPKTLSDMRGSPINAFEHSIAAAYENDPELFRRVRSMLVGYRDQILKIAHGAYADKLTMPEQFRSALPALLGGLLQRNWPIALFVMFIHMEIEQITVRALEAVEYNEFPFMKAVDEENVQQ